MKSLMQRRRCSSSGSEPAATTVSFWTITAKTLKTGNKILLVLFLKDDMPWTERNIHSIVALQRGTLGPIFFFVVSVAPQITACHMRKFSCTSAYVAETSKRRDFSPDAAFETRHAPVCRMGVASLPKAAMDKCVIPNTPLMAAPLAEVCRVKTLWLHTST